MQPATATLSRPVSETVSRHVGLRIACWTVLLSLGAVQAWIVRFVMNPDGISYLDMGDAYWRGDWHNAINAYWSPLYSWILDLFLKVLKPTPYWEYPVVHLANFVIYIAALMCFEFFLATFVRERIHHRNLLGGAPSGLTEHTWWLLGYSLFAATSLMLIGLYRVCPDLCVAGFVYLASALIIRIRAGSGSWRDYLFLGVVLGLAYLAKAVMFPLAFVFLAAVIPPVRNLRKQLASLAIATLAFLAVAAPLCAAISTQKGRLTFGESGSWNYAFYVNGHAYWPAGAPWLKHPPRQLSASPPIYEFGEPVGGTFPPWFDPTYWHDGIKPKLWIRGSFRPIANALRVYEAIFFVVFLHASLAVGVLYLFGGQNRRSIACAARNWDIALPAVAPLFLYSLIHAEGRFVAASVTVIYLVAYAGVPRAPTQSRTKLTQAVVAAVAAISLLTVIFAPRFSWPVTRDVYAYPRPVPGPVCAEAALALQRAGVQPNDRIGLIWKEKWGAGAAEGPYVPRLLRLKIVSEATDADGFWKLDPRAKNNVIERLRATRIRAILARRVPESQQEGWSRLGNTEYFALFFPENGH